MSDTIPPTDPKPAAEQPPAETAAGGAPEAEVQQQQQQAQQLAQALAERDAARSEADANRDLYLRSLADLDNFRRRVQKDKDESRQIAVGRLLEDFVPVFDTLSLALLNLKGSQDPAAIARGVESVQAQFRSALERNGVAEIAPAPGDAFDPHRHESLSAQPHPEIAEGSITATFRVGFLIGNRLLRPASVILSSGPAAS